MQKEITYQQIGANIKRIRKSKLITAELLAKELGVHKQMIWRYELGECKIPIDRLCILSQVLDVPISAFMNKATDDGEQMILFLYNKLSNNDKAIAIVELRDKLSKLGIHYEELPNF